MRAAFKLLTVLLGLMTGALPALAGDALSPPEALERTRARAVTLVDVRTPVEWNDTGIPAGAKTFSWGRPDFVQGVLGLVQGDRNAPLVLICRSGNRSGKAMAALREAGFTNVSHVGEGMAGNATGLGWLGRGLPVEEWKP